MADNLISQVGANLVSKVFSGLIWFFIAIIIIAVLLFVIWFFFVYKKKFDIKVKVVSERSGEDCIEIFDKGAILYERKEKTPYLRVWTLKRDFVVPKFKIMRKVYEGNKSVDYIEIYRKGENEFYFLMPPKIDNRKIVKEDGKIYLIAEQKQLMMDPEMAFWATKRKTLNKKMIDTESLIFKLLPYLGIMLGGVILIFILYILLDHLPGILAQLRELVAEMKTLQRAEVVTSSQLLPILLKWKIKY